MAPERLQSIKKVLIANRGEIAVRCIRACKSLQVQSVAIYTESDATSLHVALADASVPLTKDGVAGYLNIDEILAICKQNDVDAVIPGYGLLSENADFARRVAEAGMVFVGPSSESIAEMGDKHRARELAQQLGVPVIPGTGLLKTEAEAQVAAEDLGYPVMLKATAGGGGVGLQICHSAAEISTAFPTVQNQASKLFKSVGILLEKYIPRSHHVEVQVFGNGEEVVHFGERECSVQRRHQKVIEECPSPFVMRSPGLLPRLTRCAKTYASALHYRSAGTVEFLVDDDTAKFYFLEMNTRLQVEHGITELCYGVDLVALMLRQADAEKSGLGGVPSPELQSLQKLGRRGVAVEVRLYAEDPYRNFSPSPGLFQEVRWPERDGVRVDTWVRSGQQIGTLYDPLLAKVMVHADTRELAVRKMVDVCSRGVSSSRHVVLKGPTTNLGFVRAIMSSRPFVEGQTFTNFLDTGFSYHPSGAEVKSPGAYTTIQDFPGRPSLGFGIPKGGPMDSVSARIANMLVGNPPEMAFLECTLQGPELLFTSAAVVSVCGATCSVHVDGIDQPMWSSLEIRAGQTVKVGAVQVSGCRIYIAVRGGFPNTPSVFKSTSTTPGLKIGGHQGRELRRGDFLETVEDGGEHFDVASSRSFPNSDDSSIHSLRETESVLYTLPKTFWPDVNVHRVHVMQGPHDSDDIMTAEDRDMLYSAEWTVGHNSFRTGIRLSGPSPKWARKTGGAAGSHPSNYLDYGYPSPGGVNWGGDSPTILTADSPNFGGLVCSATVVSAELWKLGQLKPGDKFRMTPVSLQDAIRQITRLDTYLEAVSKAIHQGQTHAAPVDLRMSRAIIIPNQGILKEAAPVKSRDGWMRPRVVYRQGGDRFLLVEFGSETTSPAIIVRIEQLIEALRRSRPELKLLMTPHVGSLTIEYDPTKISQKELLSRVSQLECGLGANMDIRVQCREVRLPLVFDHPALRECTERYMATTRSTATYLPDNVEYIQRANGLSSRRAVFDRILTTDYLVAAVGFLAGMPMLYPLTPAFLTAQKYNPPRASTPGGTVGLGGSLLSLYPVESPGGYMMAARTLEMWDPYGNKPGFAPGKPWMLEPFDKVRFFEVSAEKYDAIARDFAAGKYEWQISPAEFDVRGIRKQLEEATMSPGVVKFLEAQKKALAEEEAREEALYAQWKMSQGSPNVEIRDLDEAIAMDDGNTVPVFSPMSAVLWKLPVKQGDVLREGQVVAILESMKMEVNVLAPKEADGLQVFAVFGMEGNTVNAGDAIVAAKEF